MSSETMCKQKDDSSSQKQMSSLQKLSECTHAVACAHAQRAKAWKIMLPCVGTRPTAWKKKTVQRVAPAPQSHTKASPDQRLGLSKNEMLMKVETKRWYHRFRTPRTKH